MTHLNGGYDALDTTHTAAELAGLSPAIITNWVRSWRAFSPLLPTVGLVALAEALAGRREGLIREWTVRPSIVPDATMPPTGCCPIAFVLWHGFNLATVGDVMAFWAEACLSADEHLGEPAGCRHLFFFWDDAADYAEAKRLLLEEVDAELMKRGVSWREITAATT